MVRQSSYIITLKRSKSTFKKGGAKISTSPRKSPRKSPKKKVFILVEKGTLTQYGYSSSKSEKARHTALKKAIVARQIEKGITQHEAALSVFRKLNAIATLNKKRNQYASKIFKTDSLWVKKKFF